MSLNRRQFVVGAGSALGAAGLATTVLADDDNDDVPVEIAEVFPVADVVILENTGDDDVDLQGFVFDFLHDADTDYTDEINEDVTLEAGETVSIWTGFQSTQIEDVEADVQIGDFDNGRINAQEDEVIALLDADGNVVDETDETSDDGQSYEDYVADQNGSDDDGDDNGDDDNGDENGDDDNGDDDNGDENGDDDDGEYDDNGDDDDDDESDESDDESDESDEDYPEDDEDEDCPEEDEPEDEPEEEEEDC